MLEKSEAKDLLAFVFEGSRVETGIDLEEEWVFRAFLPIGGGEKNMSPFFGVNKLTGAVRDFPVASYPNLGEFARLFAIADAADKPSTPQEALKNLEEKRG